SDSTNAEVPGFTPSERAVMPALDRVFAEAPGRLLITTFASSVHRLNIILQLAQKYNRKVTVLGRSMLNVIAHARTLGYIRCSDDVLQPLHVIRNLPDEQVVILTTGSQGEPLSALTRIANREHKDIQIRPTDTVVFSANPIPGNTIAVVNTIDKLMAQGAKVIYGKERGIHVSGHGCQEDQKLMLALTKPKFFIPIHGEHRMLVKHSETAQALGIPKENIVIVDNGDVIELTPDRIQVVDRVKAGIELVDASGDGIVSGQVLQDRQQLAGEGVVTVAAAIDGQGQLWAMPEVHIRGVVTTLSTNALRQLVHDTLTQTVQERWSEFAVNGTEIDWTGLRDALESALQRLIRREFKSQPLLIFLLQTPTPTTAPATEDTQRRSRKRRSEVATL
ncbi:MAG: ribonuclease J, partial [Gloeomargarita sp. SKYG98]|nr:ribonuclease J [Gloeomargarita sp. SKYG98]